MKIKKALAVMLAMGMIGTATLTASATETNIDGKVGEVNLDGIINIDDATQLQKYLAGLETLSLDLNSTYDFGIADTNNDGIISIDDVTEIQKYLAGLGGEHIKNAVWCEAGTEVQVWVEPVTKQVWVEPVTKQVWVEPETKQVWVEAVTHEETTYEKKARAICNDCGADLTDLSSYDLKVHLGNHIDEGGVGAYHIEYKNVAVGTTTVVDKEGYYKTETVTEGYYKTETIKEGYYKTETVKEGYYKTVVVKEAGWY